VTLRPIWRRGFRIRWPRGQFFWPRFALAAALPNKRDHHRAIYPPHYLRKLAYPTHSQVDETKHLRKLVPFVPVGLAIGIMSPVSMLVIRGMLSYTLSWDDVGYLQALWRFHRMGDGHGSWRAVAGLLAAA
jgi:hypothetical protein